MRHESFSTTSGILPVFPVQSARFGSGLRDLRSAETQKRILDLAFAVIALPVIAVLAVLLFLVNPLANPGPVFFRQTRMGLGGHQFVMLKFRTMLPSEKAARGHDEPLEEDRITPLGRFLRKYRIDEFPNFVNVLRGEMSVVGPRPDAWNHAITYISSVPHYSRRFTVKPGITGLAQVRNGYAESAAAVRRKARLDSFYVSSACPTIDLYIMAQTVKVMLTGLGAK